VWDFGVLWLALDFSISFAFSRAAKMAASCAAGSDCGAIRACGLVLSDIGRYNGVGHLGMALAYPLLFICSADDLAAPFVV